MEKNMDEERRNLRVQIEKTQDEIDEKTRDITKLAECIDDMYEIKRHAGSFFEELKEDFMKGEASEETLLMEEERQNQIGFAIRDYENFLEEAKNEKKSLERLLDEHEEEYRKLRGE